MNFIRKFIRWFLTPNTSIFRMVPRPTMGARLTTKEDGAWITTYIICDVCKKDSTDLEVDHNEQCWKCEKCRVLRSD